MTQEYPKALYRGSTAIYDTQIANDLDHEIELREADYVDFSELSEPVVEDRSATGTGSKTHDGLVEKLAWTEDQLETAKAELIAFKNDVTAMYARIAELQGDIYVGQSSQMREPPYTLIGGEQENDAVSTTERPSEGNQTIPDQAVGNNTTDGMSSSDTQQTTTSTSSADRSTNDEGGNQTADVKLANKSFSDMQVSELREELNKRNIKFKVRDSKDDLIALLGG